MMLNRTPLWTNYFSRAQILHSISASPRKRCRTGKEVLANNVQSVLLEGGPVCCLHSRTYAIDSSRTYPPPQKRQSRVDEGHVNRGLKYTQGAS